MRSTASEYLLQDLAIAEISAFIAAPLAGMTLGQMGANVIRIDQTGGGPDHDRWPLGRNGTSLYWQGMNKAKRSVHLDLRSPEGRAAAQQIIARQGIFVTNRPAVDWLSYETLSALRPDLIMVAIRGTFDHRIAVDYTIQARSGLPFLTGEGDAPVNQMMPAWDTVCGLLAANGILGAVRRREATGQGAFIDLSLEDCALWMLGNLGMLAEAETTDHKREALGNHVYGTFGRDFECSDGERVMVVTVSSRHWRALCEATEMGAAFGHLEQAMDADFRRDADRYRCRNAIAALLEPWFGARTLADVSARLESAKVLWGLYQSVQDLVTHDPVCSEANPMFAQVTHPDAGRYLTPGLPLDLQGQGSRDHSRRVSRQGADTEGVLRDLLGLGPEERARLIAEQASDAA